MRTSAEEALIARSRSEVPVVLHIGHGWGGGIERWVHDYAAVDEFSWNLLLRSRTWRNEAGIRLELVDPADPDAVLMSWELETPIRFTTIAHDQYRSVIHEVTACFGVEAIVVSSLIGHSLDALDTGLPTAVVLHDFYPFCPALFAWFGSECTDCAAGLLQRCLDTNPQNVFWHHRDADQWMVLRAAYAERLARDSVQVAAPGNSVFTRYARLFPVLRDKHWALIPHGLSRIPTEEPSATAEPDVRVDHRLRVLIPGRMLPHKGLQVFTEMLDELLEFADVMLLGCGDNGLPFRVHPQVSVVPDYANEAMADLVRAYAPDCALLLSQLPETFSYTLSEMFALHVPVVATRLGAFEERIEDGVNGFLVQPDAVSVISRLRGLDADRAVLQRVESVLRRQAPRSVDEMVHAYRELLGLRTTGEPYTEMRPRMLASQFLARGEEIQRAREREAELSQRLSALEHEVGTAWGRVGALDGLLAEQHAEAERLQYVIASLEAARDEILASTSWRMTQPLRTVMSSLRGEKHVEQVPAEPPVEPETPEVVALTPEPGLRVVCRREDALWAERAPWFPGFSDLSSSETDAAEVLSPGFSLMIRRRAEDGVSSVTAFYSGLDAAAADSAAGFVAGLDRVLLPGRQFAESFRRNWPDVQTELVVTVLPPVCSTPSAAERAFARDAVREGLGLPDGTRLVMAIESPDDLDALVRFARLATRMCAARNDCRFVWIRRVGALPPPEAIEVGLPVALRHLFVVEAGVVGEWLAGGDIYLGMNAADVCDGGLAEALVMGLQLAVRESACLPGMFSDARFSARVATLADDDAAVDWLCATAPGAPVVLADDASLPDASELRALRLTLLGECGLV